MIDDLKKQLPGYEIITITRQNFGQIFEVYDTNPAFFLLTSGKNATIESCIDDVDSIPPGFDINQKAFLSIWSEGKAIGVLDLLKGYPDQTCIWIGLLLISGKLQGNKIGSKIVTAILNASKIANYKSVQLGVIESNARGMAFWQKNGFEKIRTKENIIVMEKHIV